jgi:4-amino-4-deoxy-L-arabinose transferase-like glycosyltransferase
MLVLLLLYSGSIHRDIVGPGESRVAQLAWEMQHYGSWLLPSFNGEVTRTTLTKPPLYHWLVVASASPFHWQNFSLRLVSLFSALASIWLVWQLGQRMFGDFHTSAWAALVLASSLVFAVYGLSARMDIFFSMLILWAMLLLYQVLEKPQCRSSLAGFFVITGLAMLVKGPVGFIIPVSTALLMAFTMEGQQRIRRLLPAWGIGLFLVIGLSWYLAVLFLAPPEAVRSLFIDEPLNWAAGNANGVQTRIWYYLPLLLGGLFPWSPFLAAALVAALRQENLRQQRPLLFLLFWFLGGLVLFSLGGKKAIRYLLPILPAAALLVGWYFLQLQQQQRAGSGALLAGALVTLITCAVSVALLLGLANPETGGAVLLEGRNPTDRIVLAIFWETIGRHRLLSAFIALAMLVLSFLALKQLHRAKIQAAILGYTLISWILLGTYFHALLPVKARVLSPQAEARYIHAQVGEETLYGGGKAFQRAMHWYLHRRFNQVPGAELRRIATENLAVPLFIMHRKPLSKTLLALRPHCQWHNPKFTTTFFPAAGSVEKPDCNLVTKN